jgi:2-amino-4-hydroxy-6-hydroxymethyldihydropteridine diphosphokinase
VNHVYLLIGSNKGDRKNYLEEAGKKIIQQIGLIRKRSPVYETEPWGFDHESYFLNQCVLVLTPLSPYNVLRSLKEIEKQFGRRDNPGIYISREMDIDILFYNDIILRENDLIVPHPLLHERMFTLVPLADIAPGLIHPFFKKTVGELLLQCPDKKKVVLFPV